MCIKDIMGERAQRDTHLRTTQDMYDNVRKFLGRSKLVAGTTIKADGKNVRLAKEVKLDREYACMYVNTIIAMSRYPEYDQEKGFCSLDNVTVQEK